MASVDLEYNQGFKIYKGNTWFNNLVLHKATYETVVMSLGDKISGIVYYKNNKLVVNMTEYIMYKNVKYVLVNPPTVIKEGLVSDNGELKGMTKYSFTFYHPMYMLSNFPFSDIAVSTDQQRYLSQNKTFSWIGNLTDYVAKLNKNLEGTQWKVSIGTNVTDAEKNKLSEVLSFDNNTIADALKTAYETWEIPYIIDQTYEGSKRFLVRFGLPNNEIYEKDKNGNFVLDDNNQKIPFVFKYGQGVGLKNNSRTPKNNKIVTRIAGYGSEDNIPYGYPQIVWTGNQSWNYTINNDSTATNSYPIYDGIVGGQKVRLIKHPFTRTHLMPPIYSETVNKKVNPNATGYNPDIELVDYYDANDNTYPNQIKDGEPSYEIHEFEDIKPEFGSFSINSATPYDGHSDESITQNKFLSIVDDLYTETDVKAEKTQLNALRTSFVTQQQYSAKGTSGNYEYDWSFKTDGLYKKVKYASSGANFEYVVKVGLTPTTIDWDDTMDEQGNYVQSYFKVTIPALGFDLYASAAITQEMTINMRSGACIGCSFPVMVDWDDYKRNFYDKDGNFAPNGTQRNYTKYPNSTNASITLILQKETNTFGTLMPNIYQKPASGDKFVILGISLPTSYITTAEGKLETEMKKYMRDNNVYYYEYPLKFDEHFLISNEHILSQMKPNVIVNFEYADVEQSLYIKQMSIKYNESPLPKYDITLTDDVDVVLNKIGEAIAEYRGQRQYENGGGNSETLDGNKFLRKDINDTASGTIRMLKGLQVGERFVTGLLGEGGIFRKDDDGTTYLECDRMYVRMKAYFDTVEVRRFLHSGGNRIASAAGMKCSRVEYIAKYGNTYVVVDANGRYWVNNSVVATLPIERYRCYFRAEDNGAKITNDFVIGDLAYCKETNIDTNLSQHGYWRAIVDVSGNANANGEHWIDLSASDCLSGSDIPIAQDDIIQLGNKTDKKRQGAIVEFVSGEDAPSYQIYQGINTYNLNNKNYIGLGYSSEKGRAYMNVYGDMFVGVKPDSITGKSPTYIKYVQDDGTEQHNPKLTIKGIVEMLSPDDPTKTTTLDDFAKAITGDIEYLQQQIDGEIDTWFYDGEPALNKYPASEWTTDTEKKEHLGDLYYDKLNGKAYRFIYDKDSETYSWLLLSDSAILEALRIANEAKDTADHKRRVFLTDAQHPHPTPPYDEGDLWVNAVWPYEGQNIGSTYNDEFLKCTVAKAAGQGFAISDWSRTSTHAENVLQDFIEGDFKTTLESIQTQVDHKAETWYQGTDPAYMWVEPHDVRLQHVGDLWYCTADIAGTNFKENTTWQYFDNGTGANPRYEWKQLQQNVPEEVFDKIDGKCAIYVEWDAWMTGSQKQFNQLQEKDLFIPSADTTEYGVTFKANKIYRCINAYGELIEWPVGSGTMVRVPRFQEIAYTDDSAFNEYITQILNGTTKTTDSATVANALNAITTAIIKAPATTFNGGLVLTSLIGMRDANSNVWAGISGLYKTIESVTGQYKGHGIAAWYGGGMADWEVYKESNPTATISDTYAKSLFRFDGSGYVAGGNVTWDKNGAVTIKNITTLSDSQNTNLLNELATFNNAFTFNTSGTGGTTVLSITPKVGFTALSILDTSVSPNVLRPVATQKWVSDNYVPLAFFNALFSAFSTASPTSSTTPINPSTWTASTVINNLKIKVGTWTEQYLSALGNNPSSGGQDTFNADLMWKELGTNSTAKLIPQSHLNLSGYALTNDVTKNLTIKQTGKADVVYNGTEAKTITISAGTEAKNINDNTGASFADVLSNQDGTFFFYGNNLVNGQFDWVGIQVENKSGNTLLDKGQLVWSDGTLLTRQNDGSEWTQWATVLTDKNLPTASSSVLGGVKVNGNGLKMDGGILKVDASTLPDISSGYVTLTTNQTITGLKTFEYTVTDRNVPLLKLNDKGTINESRMIWALRPNMTSQQWAEISVGKSATSKNLGQLSYKHVGDGLDNNFISLGIYGVGTGLCVYGNRSVYIGGYVDEAPSSTLHVNGTCYTSGNSSIGGKLLVGASSTNFRMHVVGGIVAEYDSGSTNYKGSFRSLHGNFMGSFGVNASGYTVFVTSDGDGNNGTTIMSLTPYNVTNKYVLFPYNVKVGEQNNTAVDGSYVKIGGVYLIYDQTNNAIRVSGSSSLMDNTNPANIYAVGGVSALGSQSSGGQDTFNVDLMWQELGTNSTAKLIPQSHLNLSGYALQTDLNGFVRSIKVGDQTKTPNANGLVDLGSIAADGYVTPIAAGQVNTAKGDSKVWFKRASISNTYNDGTPNNGFVIEYGNSTSWVGQLYLGDNATQGLYWNGWSDGVRGSWKKIAFTSDLDNYTKTSDFKSLSVKVGQTSITTYKPSADSALTFKAGTNISLDTTTANQIEIKNTYSLPSATANALGGVKVNGYGLKMDNGVLKVDDLSGTYVTLTTAQTITGLKTFEYTVTGGSTPLLKLNDKGTANEARMIWALRPNMTAGKWAEISVGKSVAVYHLGQLSYKHVADSSANNFISLGIYGVGAGLAVYGNRSVYIGGASDTAPTHKLYVNGSTYTTLVDFGDGITLQKVTENGVTSLKCTGNFYATGAVSALGSNTSGGGSTSDISVDVSLSGTTLTVNVSGVSDSVNLSSISGTSGNYIPLSGSNAITGDLKPASNDAKDLGNSGGNRWRQIHGKNFVGETIELSGVASVKSLRTTNVLIESNLNNGYLSNEINNFTNHLYLQYSTSKGLSLCYGGGSVAIGDTPGSFKFKVNGTSKFTDNVGIATDPDDDSDIRLKVDGDIKALSFIPMSDIRKKDIVDYVIINRIEDIARTPIFNFTWKNREKKTLHLGTSAQYIQDIFPNAVTHFSDGDIGLDYGATALAAAVFTARKVVDHELRIKQLEQENAILRKEIEELKAA